MLAPWNYCTNVGMLLQYVNISGFHNIQIQGSMSLLINFEVYNQKSGKDINEILDLYTHPHM